MAVFSGNSATSATSTAYDIPKKIKSLSLVNKTGGAITVNASIFYGSTNIWITPYEHPLAANQGYFDDKEIIIPAGYQIYVLVSGSTDYYFTLTDVNL